MKSYTTILLAITTLYVLTHLPGLTTLPVFADESIYIRWAQLAMDDWGRYAFFPLNDGKTPLFFWFLIPFQFLGNDQLWAARLPSVLIGLGQVFATGWLIKELGGKKMAQVIGMLAVTLLPFWWFHHRMVLTDGLLTLFLTILLGVLLKLRQKTSVNALLGSAFLFGIALWTKVPAILFAPVFVLTPILPVLTKHKKTTHLSSIAHDLFKAAWPFAAAGLGGLLIFLALRISPAFGQLFSRGSDFLFPWKDVFFKGLWQQTLPSIPTYLYYHWHYLTGPIIGLAFSGLFIKKNRHHQAWLWLGCLGFALPIMILGRVVYPRYFVPGILFLTVSAALAAEYWLSSIKENISLKPYSIFTSVITALLTANVVSFAAYFILAGMFTPSAIPFVSADKEQYLKEWSAGFGNIETVQLIRDKTKTTRLAVATEGRFGTLPDGLMMYFHRQDVSNLFIDGIGQPVTSISKEFADKTAGFDEVWLVVNSHRKPLFLPANQKLYEFCRPVPEAPCLEVWDITKETEAVRASHP